MGMFTLCCSCSSVWSLDMP